MLLDSVENDLVIVEKPFTPTSAEADELITIAKNQQRLLTVYHSMCANPGRFHVLIHKLRPPVGCGFSYPFWADRRECSGTDY